MQWLALECKTISTFGRHTSFALEPMRPYVYEPLNNKRFKNSFLHVCIISCIGERFVLKMLRFRKRVLTQQQTQDNYNIEYQF